VVVDWFSSGQYSLRLASQIITEPSSLKICQPWRAPSANKRQHAT